MTIKDWEKLCLVRILSGKEYSYDWIPHPKHTNPHIVVVRYMPSLGFSPAIDITSRSYYVCDIK